MLSPGRLRGPVGPSGAAAFACRMILGGHLVLLLALLPVNFSYPVFALVIVLNGLGMGIFFSPNRRAS